MARSVHAYVRGSTVKFYEWLDAQKSHSLPEGPPVWICGDCHAGNLGPVANAEGDVEIQIRDLDQTVIGNPAHDLIRLALSLATASRGSNLPGITIARILENMIEGYASALANEDVELERPKAVGVAMKESVARSWKHLAKERIKDLKPTIPLGSKFWPLKKSELSAIGRLFKTDEMAALPTLLRSRDDETRFDVVDSAYWMKGCSSLGLLRFAVLLQAKQDVADLCLIDIKEAVSAAAPRHKRARMPRDNAQRIVEGARHLSPHLGERMAAGKLLDRSVFVRELLPQDLKLEIEQVSQEEAAMAARYLAGVVGKAHGRQMDAPTRKSWARQLQVNHSKSLDAPSWLWSSVVALIASHETAYLEHCRKQALLNGSRIK
jgi:uncharacterized protein (DUF2252 family)